MYPQNVIERAKHLYIIEGLSFEAIARILKPEYPKISGVTIKSWADKKDQFGETWHDKLNRKLKQDDIRLINAEKSKRRSLLAQVSKLRNEANQIIEKQIQKNKFKFTISDFLQLAKFEIQLEDAEKQSWNPEGVAEKLLNVFYSDPKIKKILEQRMPLLLPKIYEILGKTIEKEIPTEKEITNE